MQIISLLFRRYFSVHNVPYTYIPNFFTEKMLNKREIKNNVIFCINTGRSGSQYLADLLGSCENVLTFHEPKPKMTKNLLFDFRAESKESYKKRRVKCLAINKALMNAGSDDITYFESSHMFAKSFYDVVLDYYKNIKVIHLRRNIYKIIKSFYELGYYHEKNYYSDIWMPKMANGNSQIEKIIEYVLFIERRRKEIELAYPNVSVIDFRLEDANRLEYIERKVSELGLKVTDRTFDLYNKQANKRISPKNKRKNFLYLPDCKELVDSYLEKYDSVNVVNNYLHLQ